MSTTTPTAYVAPDEGAHHLMPDGDHVAKATVRDSEGAFELFEIRAVAGPPVPQHASPWSGVLYVLEGTVAAVVDGTSYQVPPGGLVTMPAGVPCTFAVDGDEARFLAVTTGDGAGRFFAEAAAAMTPGVPLEEAMATIAEVNARHGVALDPI